MEGRGHGDCCRTGMSRTRAHAPIRWTRTRYEALALQQQTASSSRSSGARRAGALLTGGAAPAVVAVHDKVVAGGALDVGPAGGVRVERARVAVQAAVARLAGDCKWAGAAEHNRRTKYASATVLTGGQRYVFLRTSHGSTSSRTLHMAAQAQGNSGTEPWREHRDRLAVRDSLGSQAVWSPLGCVLAGHASQGRVKPVLE
jgi:hypothetical protein